MASKVVLAREGSCVEYEGSTLSVGTVSGCLQSIVNQANEPELVRRIGMVRYIQTLQPSAADAAFRGVVQPTAERVFLNTRAADVMVPEVLFKDTSSDQLLAANGVGTVRDCGTGATMYHGSWKHGMRHGNGKAAIYSVESSGELAYIGEYDGNWVNGQRHGHGVLVEDCGDKYEGQWAYDMRHGTGVMTTIGGGVWKGCYCRDKLHGVGTFSWPTGPVEGRHYEHGELVSSYIIEQSTLPRVASNMAMAASGAPMQRVTSAQLLHQPLTLPAEDDGHVSVPTIESLQAPGDHGFGTYPSSSPPLLLPYTHPANRPNAAVLRFLKHSTINDVPGGRTGGGSIVTVESKETVEICLTKMSENNVLSVPVFDVTAERFIAIIHLLDIFAFMLDLVAKKKASFSPAGPSVGLRETLAHQRRFATAPISEVLEMSNPLNPTAFKPLPEKAPLIYAAQILSEGAHAVPIMDTAGNIVRMLTQADIIRFLGAHLDELGPMASMTVGDLGLGGNLEHLVVARFSDKAFDVFAALRQKGAPAAPVVDNYGAMAANISFSDVKAIAKKANFSALQLPVSQFFTAIEKGSEIMNPSIYVKANTTFSSIVLTLAATKIHQLYFVDDALHPVGTVRVVDLLKVFTKDDSA